MKYIVLVILIFLCFLFLQDITNKILEALFNKLFPVPLEIKTMAVEKGTGRIATEYGLKAGTSDLEDHLFIKQRDGKWKDTGKGK